MTESRTVSEVVLGFRRIPQSACASADQGLEAKCRRVEYGVNE